MKILIINPNTNVETTNRIRLVSERAASDGTTIETVTAPDGVKIIKTLQDTALAAEMVLSILSEQASTCDAAVTAAFSDPGLRLAKKKFSIPVVGIAEAAMLDAATRADRFSIITMGPDMVGYLRERAVEYGVDKKLATVRILPWSVRTAGSRSFDILSAECRKAVELDGADTIIIGGGPLAGFAEQISRSIKVPVLDGTVCAVRLAERLVHRLTPFRQTLNSPRTLG